MLLNSNLRFKPADQSYFNFKDSNKKPNENSFYKPFLADVTYKEWNILIDHIRNMGVTSLALSDVSWTVWKVTKAAITIWTFERLFEDEIKIKLISIIIIETIKIPPKTSQTLIPRWRYTCALCWSCEMNWLKDEEEFNWYQLVFYSLCVRNALNKIHNDIPLLLHSFCVSASDVLDHNYVRMLDYTLCIHDDVY